MKKYIGGYFLIKPRKANCGSLKGKTISTCSSCINDSLYDSWAISWTEPIDHQIETLRTELEISEEKQKEIQKWVDQRFEEERVGWLEVFQDLETVTEYSNSFFSHIDEKEIMKVIFPENEANAFLEEFKPRNEKEGVAGIYQNLIMQTENTSDNSEDEFLGYDLIGVEYGGAGFHTFHCHDLTNDLTDKFGLKVNEKGLIESVVNEKELVDYMNDEENGFEPVPWFLVEIFKIKKAPNTVYRK